MIADNSDIGQKNSYQAELFRNRLLKRYCHLKKWAKRNGIFSYRIYDRDIPEIPLVVDLYTEISSMNRIPGKTYLHIALYERPYEKKIDEEMTWLALMRKTAAETLDIEEKQVFIKMRKKQRGDDQYDKNTEQLSVTDIRKTHLKKTEIITAEQNALFWVNLSDYIDTGLFFDHRPLRKQIRDICSGRHVLNLFCYTGSFSVYAGQGNASSITSVDLSPTYLAWAEKNLELNGFETGKRFQMIQGDAVSFLSSVVAGNMSQVCPPTGTWDIIILDPPTFSNSKRTDTLLDINRDWPTLVNYCLDLLSPGGTLFFSTNSRRMEFSESAIFANRIDAPSLSVLDISSETIPEDFRNSRIHRCWSITRT
jgi:23S rRNA (cytosine1962-C5)-methyltransferase